MSTEDRLEELACLYVLDAASEDERRLVEDAIRADAAYRGRVAALRRVADALLQAVPQVEPSPSLRARVLEVARSTRNGSPPVSIADRAAAPPSAPAAWPAWLAAAAAIVVAVGLGAYSVNLQERIAALQAELADAGARLVAAETNVAQMRTAVLRADTRSAVLAAPDLAAVSLAGLVPAPGARARAFWSRSRGLIFTASSLPPLPSGRTYQLWVVTADQRISAGLVEPDAQGNALEFFPTPVTLPNPVAMAVTLEPAGGAPQPTGAMYLLGNVGI